MSPDELTDICNQLAEGKSLRAICRERTLAESSVRRWILQDEQSVAQTARARELGCDALADECLAIADDAQNDWMERHAAGNQGWEINGEAIRRSQLRIDTRLKLIGKWSQRYGDKLTVNTNKTVTHRYDLDSLSDERLDELERILADAARDTSGSSETPPAALH